MRIAAAVTASLGVVGLTVALFARWTEHELLGVSLPFEHDPLAGVRNLMIAAIVGGVIVLLAVLLSLPRAVAALAALAVVVLVTISVVTIPLGWVHWSDSEGGGASEIRWSYGPWVAIAGAFLMAGAVGLTRPRPVIRTG